MKSKFHRKSLTLSITFTCTWCFKGQNPLKMLLWVLTSWWQMRLLGQIFQQVTSLLLCQLGSILAPTRSRRRSLTSCLDAQLTRWLMRRIASLLWLMCRSLWVRIETWDHHLATLESMSTWDRHLPTWREFQISIMFSCAISLISSWI